MDCRPLEALTLIVPFYRNPRMLERQVEEWGKYPSEIRIVVVDDGSPEPALPIVVQSAGEETLARIEMYRVTVDIPWNRGGARNLGAHVAKTNWIIHVDIDHVLPADCAQALVKRLPSVDRRCWYRFKRFRNGRADATRRKDKIPDEQAFGEIHPHVDSYLCDRALYWRVGGYDEDYSGTLGGGSPFLRQLEQAAPVRLLTDDIYLHVFTRDVVADASDLTLDRSKDEYTHRRRAKERARRTKAINPLRFPWERLL